MIRLYSNTIPTTSLKSIMDPKFAATHDYASTQINFPQKIAKQIINWGNENIPDEDIYTEDDKYGREKETHVTVKYGLTTTLNNVKEAITDFKPFDIKLGKISFFRRNESGYDVVKIDIISPELKELNKILSELPNEDEHPTYVPHCTIAYIKKDKCKQLEDNDEFQGITIHVDEIEFSSPTEKKESIPLK